MKPFPWGLLTILLVAFDLIFTGLYLIRKRLARKFCQRAIANKQPGRVAAFLDLARIYRLIKPEEEAAWRKEFKLEEE
jgi:hypothetical protein